MLRRPCRAARGAGCSPTSLQQQRLCCSRQRAARRSGIARAATDTRGSRAVVVGGGFAGFAAALSLAKAGASVTLLDASETPGGLSSALASAGGQLVEPGIKGFWFQYANLEALVRELGIPDPFTPFTRSGFYTPAGLQVESPIFQDLPRVPAPLGTFVHTAALFRDLPLVPDRLSALPLLKPLLEHELDEQAYRQYDSMSAYELFQSAGVSQRLYSTFLAPMLLVTLFAPPTQLSAAAALGALNYFALSQQAAFDVRWLRGPVGTLIFEPLVAKLKALGVTILGGRRVQEILPAAQAPGDGGGGGGGSPALQLNPGSGRRPLAGRVVATNGSSQETFNADAVVLAAGIPALQQLTRRSALLASAPDLAAAQALDCIDVLAVRVWLDRRVQLPNPSNVVVGFDADVGGTLFQLDALQDAYKNGSGSVLEFDVYNAASLLPLSDDAIVSRMLLTYLPPVLPGGLTAAGALRVVDSSVLRFRKAVTRFSPGSNDQLPGITTSIANLFVAGDCVQQGPGTHGCKGLSQEKAWATGLQAGNAAARFLGLTPAARVLPVEPDEPQMAAAKAVLRSKRQLQQLATGSLAAAVSSLGSSRSSSSRSSSSRSSSSSSSSRAGQSASLGPELLREDEALQELLRDEVVEQLGAAGSKRQL